MAAYATREDWQVKRTFKLPTVHRIEDESLLQQLVGSLPGVTQVSVNIGSHRMRVEYDARKIDYQAILALLQSSRFVPANNIWSKLRGRLYQFADTNIREAAKAPPPACCNKPPR